MQINQLFRDIQIFLERVCISLKQIVKQLFLKTKNIYSNKRLNEKDVAVCIVLLQYKHGQDIFTMDANKCVCHSLPVCTKHVVHSFFHREEHLFVNDFFNLHLLLSESLNEHSIQAVTDLDSSRCWACGAKGAQRRSGESRGDDHHMLWRSQYVLA